MKNKACSNTSFIYTCIMYMYHIYIFMYLNYHSAMFTLNIQQKSMRTSICINPVILNVCVLPTHLWSTPFNWAPKRGFWVILNWLMSQQSSENETYHWAAYRADSCRGVFPRLLATLALAPLYKKQINKPVSVNLLIMRKKLKKAEI